MTTGARIELLREMRRIGSRYVDVAEMLDVAVVRLRSLPTANAVYVLDAPAGVLTVVDDDTQELSIWAGLAHFVALDLDIPVSFFDLLDIAAHLCVSSGVWELSCVGA